MHILNNSWISDFWYGFIVLIGLMISIVYYVNHKKKAFRQSLLVLLVLALLSFQIHKTEKPNFDNSIEIGELSGIEDDHFGTAPDYLGSAVEKILDYVKRKFID